MKRPTFFASARSALGPLVMRSVSFLWRRGGPMKRIMILIFSLGARNTLNLRQSLFSHWMRAGRLSLSQADRRKAFGSLRLTASWKGRMSLTRASALA